MTLSQFMEGPDGQYVLEEEEYVHVQSGLDDLRDHHEIQQYIVEMDMRTESLEFDMGMEQSAHDELDAILKRGLSQEEEESRGGGGSKYGYIHGGLGIGLRGMASVGNG